MIVFLVINLVIGYVIYSQLLEKQFRIQTSLRETLDQFDEKVSSNENLAIKVANVQSRVKDAEPFVKQVIHSFPENTRQKSEISLEINSLPEEIPGLEIRRSPPMEESTLSYVSSTLRMEAMDPLYDTLILTSMTKRPFVGRDRILNGLHIDVLHQELEVAGDYDTIINFVNRVRSLDTWFEITKMDIYRNYDADGDRKMLATIQVSTPIFREFKTDLP